MDLNSTTGRRTDSILSQATSIATLEGGVSQALHRDDSIWQHAHPSQEETGYRLGSDLGIALLVPGVNTTMANGATLVCRSSMWLPFVDSIDICHSLVRPWVSPVGR